MTWYNNYYPWGEVYTLLAKIDIESAFRNHPGAPSRQAPTGNAMGWPIAVFIRIEAAPRIVAALEW